MTSSHGPLAATASGPCYRLRPSVEVFVDGAGDLYLVRPGAQDLVVRDPEQADVALVQRLVRSVETVGSLLAALQADGIEVGRSDLESKLESLVEADVALVREAALATLAGEDAERFSRQLPYLAELGDEHLLQQRLRASTVAVLGCGGLGTWAIAALASTGIGKLVLVDDDAVELSNLNRQVLYRRRDVGTAKVTAATAWLDAFDPAIEVTPVLRRIAEAGDVPPLVAEADAVVLAADWPPYDIARWVNAACVASRTPFIAAGQVPPVLKIGPTYVPGAGACFTCHESALRRESPAYDDYVASRRSAPETASTLGPASGVLGALIGLELMHLITGRRPVTQDAALILDMRTLELRRETIRREPGCPACDDLD